MSAATSALRRTPVQERSAARVQRMLDAAAQLLDELGYEATTTSLIAARAGASVGSLYQFFPDRTAVLKALANRSFERFSAQLEARLAVRPPAGWQDAVEAVIDEYVAFSRSEPAAKVLSFGGPVDRHMLDPQDDNNAVVARALSELLPDSAVEPLVLRVAVEAADGVLDLAFRLHPDGDPGVVEQAKRLVCAYLSENMEP
ncbi:MAG: TetR family transcriptional regulator [Actinobacteria bacterium]|nr:TetR family transcriptional regulator [Actinomycetota bacterium]MCA1721663.1 TetR family transcriptional regulator [Actinomycetota bacterium]